MSSHWLLQFGVSPSLKVTILVHFSYLEKKKYGKIRNWWQTLMPKDNLVKAWLPVATGQSIWFPVPTLQLSGVKMILKFPGVGLKYLCPWFLIRRFPNLTKYRISKYEIAAVSALCWLSQFCSLKKKLGIGCVNIRKFVNLTHTK